MTKTNTKKATTSVTTNVTSKVITKDNIATINPILTFNDALAIYGTIKALNPKNPKLKPLRALTYDIFKVKSLTVPKGYTLG